MKSLSGLLALCSGLLALQDAVASTSPQQVIQQPLNLASDKGGSLVKERPNIVFIITDDQDLQLDSIDYTPLTLKHLKKRGTFYKNHFVTTALCCPSRVSLWTGRQAHNTNVTDVHPPYG